MALDWGILHWIQNNISCPFLDAVVPKLTMLGNAGIIWILAGVLLLCTKKYRRQGALVLIGLLVGLLVGNVVLKHLVARSRPCWLDPSVQLLIATPTDYSFPSGHTLSSTIAATILTKTDRRFGYAAISLAVLIALSRLYLYVHFPSDVFAAALLLVSDCLGEGLTRERVRKWFEYKTGKRPYVAFDTMRSLERSVTDAGFAVLERENLFPAPPNLFLAAKKV